MRLSLRRSAVREDMPRDRMLRRVDRRRDVREVHEVTAPRIRQVLIRERVTALAQTAHDHRRVTRRRPHLIVVAGHEHDRSVHALDRDEGALHRLVIFEAPQEPGRERDAAFRGGGRKRRRRRLRLEPRHRLTAIEPRWSGVSSGPAEAAVHERARRVRHDSADSREGRTEYQGELATARRADDTDALAAYGTLLAEPVERGLEVLERDVLELVGQAGRGEIPERERRKPVRGEERSERFGKATARATEDDQRGRRSRNTLEERADETAVAHRGASHIGRDREALERRGGGRAGSCRDFDPKLQRVEAAPEMQRVPGTVALRAE